jgi:predicted MFS family arabinose efflux permease
MTLNSAAQATAMGVAAFVGGQLISRGENGLLVGYWHAALVGCVCSLVSIWLARGLVLHGSELKRV